MKNKQVALFDRVNKYKVITSTLNIYRPIFTLVKQSVVRHKPFRP